LYAPAHAGLLQDHPGRWLGDLAVPNGQVLKIGVDILTRADGSAWASIASPDQNVYDLPVKAIRTEADDAVVLDADIAELKLTWVRDHFDAEWRQGGKPLPLALRRVDAFPMKARAQTPRPPFPYRDETLAIHSKDGVVLGATLSVPHRRGPLNAVVLVAGSGPQSRHVDVDGHRPFDVLADHLARQGVAVLRYDKRGVAQSTGSYYGHTVDDLQEDAYAAVRALAARHQFARIGIVGHSEGSTIAAAVAARHPGAVDFIVSMAGPGISGMDSEQIQDRQLAVDNGASPAEVERIMRYVRSYYTTVLATPAGPARGAALRRVYATLEPADQALITKYRMNVVTLSPDYAADAPDDMGLASDPRRDWRQVRCPVLVLNGSLDHQVTPAENVAGIVAALKEGGNHAVRSAVLPSLNHGFQTVPTGAFEEGSRAAETLAPAALERIAAFARRQSARHGAGTADDAPY
jgi:pimeloyl-ACP methyl ester carboxylesterase